MRVGSFSSSTDFRRRRKMPCETRRRSLACSHVLYFHGGYGPAARRRIVHALASHDTSPAPLIPRRHVADLLPTVDGARQRLRDAGRRSARNAQPGRPP